MYPLCSTVSPFIMWMAVEVHEISSLFSPFEHRCVCRSHKYLPLDAALYTIHPDLYIVGRVETVDMGHTEQLFVAGDEIICVHAKLLLRLSWPDREANGEGSTE